MYAFGQQIFLLSLLVAFVKSISHLALIRASPLLLISIFYMSRPNHSALKKKKKKTHFAGFLGPTGLDTLTGGHN